MPNRPLKKIASGLINDNWCLSITHFSVYRDWLGTMCANVPKMEKLSKNAQHEIKILFSNCSCINSSFLADDHWKTNSKVLILTF